MSVLAVYVAWCTMLFFYQGRLIFPAGMAPPPLPTAPDSAVVERLELDGGGQVESWFMPAPGISPARPGAAVVFFHGNAELIDYQDTIIRDYHALGCSVLLPEYRGYGRSAGSPSEAGIVADAVRFYDLLIERGDVDRARIVMHGRSLGGGVAAQVAARRKPAALILESTFTSVAAMAHGYGVPRFLARHPFRTDRVLVELDIPVLIFHGTQDTIIPVRHGRKLSALHPGVTYIEYDCGHNDFPGRANAHAYRLAIRDFLLHAGIIE
jgi:fermentation-respiration switch protein FrsA (DUF1100 family)